MKHELDARRLLCPLPVIRTQNKIKELQPGDELLVWCTDPGARFDVPAWCKVHGHQVLSIEQNNQEMSILIQVNAS